MSHSAIDKTFKEPAVYDLSDPRSALASGRTPGPAVTRFAGADYAKFYETEPQEEDVQGRTWYARGQNFIVAYSQSRPGAVFERRNQPDEYVVLVPDPTTSLTIKAEQSIENVRGMSLAIVPPGSSTVTMPTGGRIVRFFTTRSQDLADKCSNAQSYAVAHPNIPPFEAWPGPRDGHRIRVYSLDVPPSPGRFGRIFRCSTFMINYLEPFNGPRDTTKLSPHHHDDFEQGSLCLEGAFTHHLRWPWTTDMNAWRNDDHEYCGSPSLAIIPPPAIHTSQALDAGINQLVDIFSPPRRDFSEKPGWVLNADEYPMPPSAS
jgi:hypothetical protein